MISFSKNVGACQQFNRFVQLVARGFGKFVLRNFTHCCVITFQFHSISNQFIMSQPVENNSLGKRTFEAMNVPAVTHVGLKV